MSKAKIEGPQLLLILGTLAHFRHFSSLPHVVRGKARPDA